MFSREPDLTTIGDNVCVNLSIIRCHSNALGIFELQPCVLGHNVTLRSGAVVQGGARLQDNSVMLERTLAMPGEIVRQSLLRPPLTRLLDTRFFHLEVSPFDCVRACFVAPAHEVIVMLYCACCRSTRGWQCRAGLPT